MKVRCLTFLSVMMFYSSIVVGEWECAPALKPDLNNDGIVNYIDLWMVGHSFSTPLDPTRYTRNSDINCDKQVNDIDWDFVKKAYGQSYPIYREINAFRFSSQGEEKYHVGTEALITFHVEPDIYTDENDFIPIAEIKVTQNIPDNFELKEEVLDKTFYINAADPASAKGVFPVRFIPRKTGKYQIVTRAETTRHKYVYTDTKSINVLSEKKAGLNVTGAINYAQTWCADEGNLKSYLYIQAKVLGKDVKDVNRVIIKDVGSALKYDIYKENLENQPFTKEKYSGGRIFITPEFVKKRHCKSAYLEIISRDYTVTSGPFKFCAKTYKAHTKVFDCNNDLSLALKDNVSSIQFEKYLHGIAAKIIFHQPEVQLYFIEPKNPSSPKEWEILHKKIQSLAMLRSISSSQSYDRQRSEPYYRLEIRYKPKADFNFVMGKEYQPSESN